MLRKILVLLATAVAIAGCSSSTPPPPPAVGRTPGSTTLLLPALADKWASGTVQLATKDARGCGRFSANVLPTPIDDDYILEIDGNHDIFFHIARADAQNECSKYGIFYATKDNEYAVKVDIQDRQCKFTLTEKAPGGVANNITTYPAFVSNVDANKVCENKDKLY